MNRIIAHLTGVLFLVGLFAVGCSGSPPATPTLPPAAASPPVTPTARIERQPSPTALPLPPPADAAPTSLPTEVPNPASTGACTNRYTFVADVSVPDNTPMTPGQVFTKTWRVRNTGTCTWSDGYMLTFAKGQAMTALPSIAVPRTAPGATAELSVLMNAPQTSGTFQGYWTIKNPQGVPLAPDLWIKITVP